ncbi:hypothetical protein [Prosthecomicrobium hirschii]|uniref:hypothetical protein n=1 Tax=Prosthecodimorpha hirschii TaxID=665126 RepID=UPI0022201159|nr:hypothetical protein [Prosthecomicrobium hirschii]MCW1844169.1 hypothetical protein [Prosthecomicrobium hirschii]
MNQKIAYQRRFDPPVRLDLEVNQRMVDRMTKDAQERGLSLKTFAKILLTAAWTARCGKSNDPELEAVVSDVLQRIGKPAGKPTAIQAPVVIAPEYAPNPVPRTPEEVLPPIQPAPVPQVIEPEPETAPEPVQVPVLAPALEPEPEKPVVAEPVRLNAIQARLVRSYRAAGCTVTEIEKRTGFDRDAILKVLR